MKLDLNLRFRSDRVLLSGGPAGGTWLDGFDLDALPDTIELNRVIEDPLGEEEDGILIALTYRKFTRRAYWFDSVRVVDEEDEDEESRDE